MGKLTVFTGYEVPENIYELDGVAYLAKGVLSLEAYFKITIAYKAMMRCGEADQLIQILSKFGMTDSDEFYLLGLLSGFNFEKFMKYASEKYSEIKKIREDYLGLVGVLSILARREKETYIIGDANIKQFPVLRTYYEKMCKNKRITPNAVLVNGISELKPVSLGGKSVWAVNGNSVDTIDDPDIEPGTSILISQMERGYLLPYFLNPQRNSLFTTCDAFEGAEVVGKYGVMISN